MWEILKGNYLPRGIFASRRKNERANGIVYVYLAAKTLPISILSGRPFENASNIFYDDSTYRASSLIIKLILNSTRLTTVLD